MFMQKIQAKFYSLKTRLINKFIRLSPWCYDIYYRYFTSWQQGSIKGIYLHPSWKKNANHVLIFTQRYWLIHTAVESAFAKELQTQGWNVTVVGCDQAIRTCDNMMYGQTLETKPLTHQCSYCSYLLKKLCQRVGVNYISIREYLERNPVQSDSLPYRDYEKIVWCSWVRLLRSQHPQEQEEFALRHSLVESCQTIDRFLTHYLEHNKVDQVIMLNGKFFAEQLLREHCHEKDIPYISYEKGTFKETLVFAKNKAAIPYPTLEKWQQRKDIPLTQEQKQRLYGYLEQRKVVGNAGIVPLYSTMTEDQKQLSLKYGIDLTKDIVVLFTNVIWDSSVVLEDTIFSNIFEWITTVINFYIKNQDTQLIIRIHPAEIKISPQQQTRDKVQDFIQSKFPTLPSNIIVISPQDDASPYTLMNLAKIGLVYTSTTGLEMALKEKPVIVCSNTHYANTEFVYTPLNTKEFLIFLSQNLQLRNQQLIYTERYAYMLYFEYMIPYSNWINQKNANYKFKTAISEMNLLRQAEL